MNGPPATWRFDLPTRFQITQDKLLIIQPSAIQILNSPILLLGGLPLVVHIYMMGGGCRKFVNDSTIFNGYVLVAYRDIWVFVAQSFSELMQLFAVQSGL